MPKIADVLKRRIEEAGSINSVAVGAGVDYGSLYRFVHEGRNLQLDVVQRLVDYFDLYLHPKPKGARKRGR